MRTPLPDLTAGAEIPAAESESLPPPRVNRGFLAGLILGSLGLALFATVQIGHVLGFDLLAVFQPPPPPLSMTQLPTAAPAPLTPAPADSRPAGSGSVRDRPPAVTTPKPRFTLRDGAPDSFLTDLDTETLTRLDALNRRLDALVVATEQVGGVGRQWGGTVTAQLAAFNARQGQLHTDVAQVAEQLTILRAEVRDLRAMWARSGLSPAPPALTGRPVKGWQATAFAGDRAWLKGPTGRTVSVAAGERLNPLGTVHRVDAERRVVVLAGGRFIR
jgi:hypothetical protein